MVRFMLCPYRASFVTQSFTQGVAIGLDLFKPFQGFSLGYQRSTLNSQLSTLTFTQGVAIGLDLFMPLQGFSRGYLR